MSRIDDLIASLCPDGVTFFPLGEVSAIRTGSRPPNDVVSPSGRFKYFNGGVTKSGTVHDANTEAGAITIPSRGSVGVVAYQDKPFWCGPLCYRIVSSVSHLNTRFLYYSLKSQQSSIVGLQQTGSIPALNKKELVTVRVPVPPVEVQHEIVRILDTFTELETELEAELEARRRQYDHYRSQILDLGEDVAWRPLREVAEVRSGWGFPHSYQGQTDGDLPFFKVSDMNSPGNEAVMYSSSNYVSRAVARTLGARPTPEGTVIFPKIGAAVATNKKRLLAVQSVYDNNVMGLVPGNRLEPRFLYYWMTTIDLSRLAHNSGAVPSIRASEMAAFRIPVPELTAQREIASTLDKFNAMISDLSVGLPAELAARRRQYEYYRDRLLTFQEAAS